MLKRAKNPYFLTKIQNFKLHALLSLWTGWAKIWYVGVSITDPNNLWGWWVKFEKSFFGQPYCAQLEFICGLLCLHCFASCSDDDDFMSYLSAEQEFLNGVGTDKVHPFIEESIFRKRPLVRVLRLLCLQCLTNNGLKAKVLDYYKREIIQVGCLFKLWTHLDRCSRVLHYECQEISRGNFLSTKKK